MKRRIAKLAVFLLLGAVVNVAVAWGVANLLGERTFVTRTVSGPDAPTVTSEHNWPREKVQGWPMRSFSEAVPLDEYSAAVTVIRLKNAKLAYGPIWPGFAINTALYAAILWLLRFGPGTARRMIRRKRGRCINCGYDLRGAEHEVCPECGARTS